MKRWIFTILLFLLLGAIVNVAVAWACCAVCDERWMPEGVSGGVLNVDLPEPVWDHCRRPELDWTCSHRRLSLSRLPVAVHGTSFQADADDGRWWAWCTLYASGWPLPSMAGELWEWRRWSPDGKRCVEFGLDREWLFLPPSERVAVSPMFGRRGTVHPIPLRPLWYGFVIDTATYAVILWLLLRGAHDLRRFVRRRRGLCPNCCYDLRGAPSGGGCPECGWKRQTEATA